MMKKSIFMLLLFVYSAFTMAVYAAEPPSIGMWERFEASFTSSKVYDNPLYDIARFDVTFTSPSGRTMTRAGFWDGGVAWKVRFMPDETGVWTWSSFCSDRGNVGLNGVNGLFECVRGKGGGDIFMRGALIRPKGAFHLAYSDGTPFFWLGDTAWNGPLKSTDGEWAEYLDFRARQGYNVIQFVTTQWRGGDRDIDGRTAFEGSGRITVDPVYFQRLDRKIDMINERGLVAAPVLLWALQSGAGRHLSPGYHLPDNEAILLAKYMVARYGGNHVVWLLGGDGRFVDQYEQRWKNIGRGVFGVGGHPGLVTLHPSGRSWYGEAYDDEDWLDIIGYQSSHSIAQGTVEFITIGPATNQWDNIPARPLINLEPLYENILPQGSADDVRATCWWSILATPVAGITYGANGIWPWLREGETILNHRHNPETRPWRESLSFPGGAQAALIATFMRGFEWWRLMPAPELAAIQPGKNDYLKFVSVAATVDRSLVVAYIPAGAKAELYNARGIDYGARWFDPSTGAFEPAVIDMSGGHIAAAHPSGGDRVLVLERKGR